ncbi:tubby C-terminal domain-like protein [Terrilactibacillus laevilacticus]|uniref:Tubby C-terminal domain-containing protein n=1 Tax=Terrilactibacillus laevilacticus TaxID=1380157 RepID=A0ABW5PNR1_9BACI|nr:hypothetical protein [Terrilactibacillus laevilacticus]
MKEYYLNLPLLKQSTKKYTIHNSDGEKIGEWQRYYKNKFQFLIDLLIGHFYFNLKVYDSSSNLVIQSFHQSNWFRDVWKIKTNQDCNILKSVTKIKTNLRYEYTCNNRIFLIKHDIGSRKIKIQDVQTITLVPPRKIVIRIQDPIIDIYTATCLFYTVATQI